MEYKTYLKFLSQITTTEVGCFIACKVKIFFKWHSEQGLLTFSSTLTGESLPLSSQATRTLKWQKDQPFFEQQGENLFLSQNVQGVPTFVEFRDLIKNFISVYQEFNDQSMGSLSQLLR